MGLKAQKAKANGDRQQLWTNSTYRYQRSAFLRELKEQGPFDCSLDPTKANTSVLFTKNLNSQGRTTQTYFFFGATFAFLCDFFRASKTVNVPLPMPWILAP
jgi:hypothetical protein